MLRPPLCALGAALLVALAASSSLAAPLTAARAGDLLAKGDLDQLYLDAAPLAHGAKADPALAKQLVEGSKKALQKGDGSLALGLADLARKLDPKSLAACLAAADAAEKLPEPAAAQEALAQALVLAPRDGGLLVRAALAAEKEGDLAGARTLFERVPPGDPKASEARAGAARVQAALAKRESDRAAQRKFDDEVRARREAATKAAQALAPADAPESEHFRLRRAEGLAAPLDPARLAPFEKAYAQVIGSFGHAPEGHVTVRLVADAERARRCKSAARVCLSDGELLLDSAATADAGLEAEAANAFTRAVIDGLAGGRPVAAWLVEGLALWHERHQLGQPAVGDTERRLLADALRLKAVPRLSQLTGSFSALGAAAPLAQAKSVAAIEALVRADAGAGRKLAHLLVRIGGGASLEEAFAGEIAPGRLGKLDAEAEALAR